jgi:hypothetical protein
MRAKEFLQDNASDCKALADYRTVADRVVAAFGGSQEIPDAADQSTAFAS